MNLEERRQNSSIYGSATKQKQGRNWKPVVIVVVAVVAVWLLAGGGVSDKKAIGRAFGAGSILFF